MSTAFFSKHIFCSSLAIAASMLTLTAKGQEKYNDRETDVEKVVNSRIVIAKQTKVFEIVSKNTTKNLPRNFQNISWSPDGKSILLDLQGDNFYFTISLADISKDKTEVKSLTDARGGQKLNYSDPAFHPDGKHFVFVAQNIEDASKYERSLPGFGLFSNLMVSEIGTTDYYPITNAESTVRVYKGACTPQFSHDGKKLAWVDVSTSSRVKTLWSDRVIKIADFEFVDGLPKISNVKTYNPSKNEAPFYEIYGFSKDDKFLIFGSNMNAGQRWFGLDICKLNLANGKIVKMTKTDDGWDRYVAISPNSKKIIWSSSQSFSVAFLGYGGTQWQSEMYSELWIMNADGSNKRQLSFFNQKGHKQYIDSRTFIGGVAWHPTDPNKIVYVLHTQHGLYNTISSIIVADLANELTVNMPKAALEKYSN